MLAIPSSSSYTHQAKLDFVPVAVTPPLDFSFSVTLRGPSGNVLGVAPTAVATTEGGVYSLTVAPSGGMRGDLRALYQVKAQLLDVLDPHAPHETLASASLATLTVPNGPALSATGRLEYVSDQDWFAFDVPARSQPTVLHYRVTPQGAGERFTLPGPADRQLSVRTVVTSGDCKNDRSVCPRALDASNAGVLGVLDAACDEATVQCVQSVRSEHPAFTSLRNFEGVLAVRPHATSLRFYFLVESQGHHWADDRPYVLEVTWLDDADEAARYSGGQEQSSVMALNVDGSMTTYPVPPGGATQLSGILSYGIGELNLLNAASGLGVRAPTATANCTPVATRLAYSDSATASWSLPSGEPTQMLYSRTSDASKVTTTASEYACLCIEPFFFEQGAMKVSVSSVDREGGSPVQYTVRTASGAYPQSYSGTGGPTGCPAISDLLP